MGVRYIPHTAVPRTMRRREGGGCSHTARGLRMGGGIRLGVSIFTQWEGYREEGVLGTSISHSTRGRGYW